MKKLLSIICVLFFSQTNSQTLIAHYPLNGNTNDIVNSNNGVLHGGTWINDSLGNSNSALLLDGLSDWIEILNSPITQNNSFTLSAWIKITNPNYNNPIIALGYTGNSTDKEVSFGTYEIGSNYSALYAGNKYNSSTSLKRVQQHSINPPLSNINLGKWYHVALVYNDTISVWNSTSIFHSIESSFIFYINGVQVSSSSNPSTWWNSSYDSASVFQLNNKMALGISKGKSNNTHYFDGVIDDIKIFSGALSTSAIQTIYNSTFVDITEINIPNHHIYQNPSINGTIKIENTKIGDFYLYDTSGKMVNKQMFTQNNVEFIDLNPGLYILRAVYKDVEFTSKIIVSN